MSVWALREALPVAGDTVAIDGRTADVMAVGKGIEGKSCLVTLRFQVGVTDNGFPIYEYEFPVLQEFLATLEVQKS